MAAILTLPEAEALAERVLAAIPPGTYGMPLGGVRADLFAADRERVASDLAGLRAHASLNPDERHPGCHEDCPDARRYSDDLRRTARLYGVEQ